MQVINSLPSLKILSKVGHISVLVRLPSRSCLVNRLSPGLYNLREIQLQNSLPIQFLTQNPVIDLIPYFLQGLRDGTARQGPAEFLVVLAMIYKRFKFQVPPSARVDTIRALELVFANTWHHIMS